ncbi:MAG: hypothetical protein ACKVQU_31230 [Burkholderiales bacterium]
MSKALYVHLQQLTGRYQSLYELFAKLHQNCQMLADPGRPLSAIKISPLHSDGYFDVTLAGTTTRFLFEFRPGESGNTKATVRCLRLEKISNRMQPIGAFQFDGQGDTAMKHPDSCDPVLLSMDSGACYVVAYYVNEALNSKSQ